MEDAAAVAELTSAAAPEPFPVHWVEREWTEPGFDLEQDARLTEGAYAAVWDGRSGKAWLDFQGAPGPELVKWAEERAREKGLVRGLGHAWSENAQVKATLERAGYRLIRHSYRMRIDLEGVKEQPAWPDGVEVRTYRAGDEQLFYDVHEETFADHWEHERSPYEEWAHWLLAPPMFEPDLWFVAEEDGEPAGIAIDHLRPELPGVGWVQILGVRRPWRRRGLGRALLLHAFHAFRERGLRQAGLGVDAESLTGATRLYESVGMRAFSRSDIYEKPLV
jgi:ribosomal protein S18 acetylase RimI-like enzyme